MKNYNFSNSIKKDYNFLNVIKESNENENLISNWLFFLLNPDTNGVGNKCVNALVKALDINNLDFDKQDFQYGEREETTDNKKRPDIILKYSKYWIVIENKIKSHENGNQTIEYYNDAINKKKDENIIFVYLKPSFNDSIPQSDKFKILTYDKLLNELEKIVIEDYSENEQYKYFYLTEFIKTINSLTDDEIDENYEKFKIENAKMIDSLCRYLNKELNGEFDISPQLKWGCIIISKKNWKNIKHQGGGIHFEIWSKSGLKVLGKKSDEICICLHMEQKINEEMKMELSKYGINRMNKNRVIVEQTFKSLKFDTDKNIEKSFREILNTLKEYDKKYTNLIDKAMCKF